MLKRLIISLLPIIVIILIPICLRKPAEAIDLEADQLVIVSPHNEAIRYEFDRAFGKYYQEKTGRKVSLDWRATGGTSEIVKYVNSAFAANFKVYWTKELGQKWDDEVALACMNRKLKAEDHPARKAFLEGNFGIGIDVMFGGGQYDMSKQAQIGTLVPCGFRDRHPELFEGPSPVFAESMGGEIWYDRQDRYYAACFSSFGICVNLDRAQQLGLEIQDQNNIQWSLLADSRLYGSIGLADPTKSGSINKCFEMLVQRIMQDTAAQLQIDVQSGKITDQEMLNRGWQNAMTLIRMIGGNSRYLTFSASKVPVDCAAGQIAAGMCIDFYGRSQAEWEEIHQGRKTMAYITPKAASTVSGDPIGLFKGAPNSERGKMFIDFVLSKEGQQIWNNRLGTENGPIRYSLNRLPVRRDLYSDEYLRNMTAPEAKPFELAGEFIYQGRWTGPYFDLLRNLIKVMLIDCEPELKSAWHKIVLCGGPQKCPEAMEAFSQIPFEHSQAADIAKRLGNPKEHAHILREWGDFFRRQYELAEKLAK